jgi:hypothetical protein
MHTRAGVEIYLRAPSITLARHSPERLAASASDLAAAADIDGVLFEAAPAFAGVAQADGPTSWQIRARRDALDAATLPPPEREVVTLFRAMQREYPTLRMALVQAAATVPVPIADLTFIEIPADDAGSAARLAPAFTGRDGRRFGAWITQRDAPPSADAVQRVARTFKMRGAMAAGWCRDDPVANRPDSDVVAPATSASAQPKSTQAK